MRLHNPLTPAPQGSSPCGIRDDGGRNEQSAVVNAARILALVKDIAAEAGVSCETLHVKDRRAAEGIIETAKANGCDLIVMGSHGRRGLGRLVLGSQANEVVTHSTVPVLVCR